MDVDVDVDVGVDVDVDMNMNVNVNVNVDVDVDVDVDMYVDMCVHICLLVFLLLHKTHSLFFFISLLMVMAFFPCLSFYILYSLPIYSTFRVAQNSKYKGISPLRLDF